MIHTRYKFHLIYACLLIITKSKIFPGYVGAEVKHYLTCTHKNTEHFDKLPTHFNSNVVIIKAITVSLLHRYVTRLYLLDFLSLGLKFSLLPTYKTVNINQLFFYVKNVVDVLPQQSCDVYRTT